MSTSLSMPRSQLTPELIEQVERILPTCLFNSTVCAVTGVPQRSYYRWLRQGRAVIEGDKPEAKWSEWERLLARFALAVDGSRARGELRDLAIIEIASAKNWRAAAWRLARGFPSKWSQHRVQLKLLHQQISALDRYLSHCDPRDADQQELERINTDLKEMKQSLEQKSA